MKKLHFPGSKEDTKRFLNALGIVALFLFCILGMGYYLLTHKKAESNPPAIPSSYQSENISSVGYRVGYKLLYNAPEESRLFILGKENTKNRTLVIKSGKHQAEVLGYDKGHSKYVIGIEVTPGILLEVEDVPPTLLSMLP